MNRAEAQAVARGMVAEQDGATKRRQAKAELARMKSSLKGWLRLRHRNDQVAAGAVKAKAPAWLVAQTLSRDRDWEGERKLAADLYVLLSEVYDPQSLPDPAKRGAAVRLAQIVLRGKLGPESPGAQAQGFVGLLIMTVGAVIVLTVSAAISNRAEIQKEKERIECIKAGACTDSGFWIKVASIGFIGWMLWDKAGLGKRIKSAVGGR